jgi:hypothetical protein
VTKFEIVLFFVHSVPRMLYTYVVRTAIQMTSKCVCLRTLRASFYLDSLLFAFGRLQSSLPKALESLFDPPPSTPPDFIEIGYSKVSYDTFLH